MTCVEAEKMVVPYMKDELSPTELEDFLDHIHTCENCREELEIHYMVDVGLKKLDEADGTYDIVGDLKRKVAESYRSLRHISMFQITTYAVSTLTGMALIVMILCSFGSGIRLDFCKEMSDGSSQILLNIIENRSEHGKTCTDRRS